jgi:hypothetical protein
MEELVAELGVESFPLARVVALVKSYVVISGDHNFVGVGL